MLAAKDSKIAQLSSSWGSISSKTRILSSLGASASVVLLVLVSTRPPRYQPHPTTLEGWQVQQQTDDTPFLGSNSRLTSAPASAQQTQQMTGPTTDAPMAVLPPFEPTCIADNLERYETWGCPVIFCSLHPSCTIYNTSCCAYLNYQMFSDFHDFLASKCLQVSQGSNQLSLPAFCWHALHAYHSPAIQHCGLGAERGVLYPAHSCCCVASLEMPRERTLIAHAAFLHAHPPTHNLPAGRVPCHVWHWPGCGAQPHHHTLDRRC